MRGIKEIKELGWQALVCSLGIADALRYLMITERGWGNYTATRRILWEGEDIEQILQKIRHWKKRARRREEKEK